MPGRITPTLRLSRFRAERWCDRRWRWNRGFRRISRGGGPRRHRLGLSGVDLGGLLVAGGFALAVSVLERFALLREEATSASGALGNRQVQR